MDTGTPCGQGRFKVHGRALAALSVALACQHAAAADGDFSVGLPAREAAPGPGSAPPRLEISAGPVHRINDASGWTRSQRVEMSWLSPQQGAAFGPLVGMETPAPLRLGGAPGLAAPRLNLGVHWRHTLDGRQQVEVMAWHRLASSQPTPENPSAAAPSYGARVEMNVAAPRRSGLVAERGFIGLQLDSGARITVKRSGGKPMVYYRSQF